MWLMQDHLKGSYSYRKLTKAHAVQKGGVWEILFLWLQYCLVASPVLCGPKQLRVLRGLIKHLDLGSWSMKVAVAAEHDSWALEWEGCTCVLIEEISKLKAWRWPNFESMFCDCDPVAVTSYSSEKIKTFLVGSLMYMNLFLPSTQATLCFLDCQ